VPNYELTEAADEDLSDIYAFTYIEFGERQADVYFESLEGCSTRLADNPQLGRAVSFVREGYRLFVHKRHLIYNKLARPGILVVRVLGPGMTPESHLP